jgi:hypothetical protein
METDGRQAPPLEGEAAPHDVLLAAATSVAATAPVFQLRERPLRPRRTEFVVVPRSADLQAAEDALRGALVAVVGGTRPPVSPLMVRRFLLD